MALRTIGIAARFFLTRYCVRTRIGPYVVTTVEVRPRAYETSVTWGEDGPEVEDFGDGLAFDPGAADRHHRETSEEVEASVGLVGVQDSPSTAA